MLGVGGYLSTEEFVGGEGNGGRREREGVEGGGEEAFVLGGGGDRDGGDECAGAAGTVTGGDLVVG